ncbi:hypothetical protein BY996DRAFT_2490737 [Phakopsora pachyrhizi]|nr:hypothetical protein BY996DRAFT_2490737 [Phakopsora pachyrhizi]
MVPISLEFLRLQDRCFATSPDNISALGSLATENQRLMEQAEIASRSDMMTTSEAIACASIASNIVQLSSCVIESNYAIQDLCTEFLKKTRFFSPNLNTYTSSIEPSSTIDRCPKPINLTQHGLRKWCKSHLSYLFPTNKQVAEFSMISEMSESQVSSWFRNARTRSGWSKLFSDKVHVNRDPSRLDIVFQDYNSYILSHCHSDICERLSYDVHFRLVDKVWRWFHTDKNCKKLEGSGSVRPWVKTILMIINHLLI